MLPPSVQILLFSATFPDRVMNYAQTFAPKANQLRLRHQQLTVKGISQMYMDCPSQQDKYDILCKLYGLMTIGSSVIFVKVSLGPVRRVGLAARRLTGNARRVRVLMKSKRAWRPTATASLRSTERTRAPTAMLSWTTSAAAGPRC